MKLALIGYGNVGQSLAALIRRKQTEFPFQITGIHTAHHGTAVDPGDLAAGPRFGPAAASIEAFLDLADADVAVELTTLNPVTGQPAIDHIRAAFARGMHVVTANKGPIAHAYADLREEAERRKLIFRFEATVMDGAPVFNQVRNNLPGVTVLGFTGVLNSTSKIVVEMGIAEADASYDVEGWDSAAKTAALANVLMDARTNPQFINTRGITRLTPERIRTLKQEGKTVRLVSRAKRANDGLSLRVRAEVLDQTDILACVHGTSNVLLLHTDLMGTIGTVSISPAAEQTAYGVFIDLVDVWRAIRS
ncbi:MAG: homoserine dehydrogenase [Acidobacteria bacterium]|nr:MAG: homoserine dehydrogenase [Acidobacteriota bacterium]